MNAAAPAIYRLTDADHALIAEARIAFRQDYRYLEEIVWAARDRHEDSPKAANYRRAIQANQARAAMRATLKRLEPRLVAHVRAHPSGCWLWTGGLTGSGQPALRLGPTNRVHQVRRWLYEQTHGPIPGARRALLGDGCEPLCVHPEHCLVLVDVRTRSHRKARPA